MQPVSYITRECNYGEMHVRRNIENAIWNLYYLYLKNKGSVKMIVPHNVKVIIQETSRKITYRCV